MLDLDIPIVPVRGQMWATAPAGPRSFHTISAAESAMAWARDHGGARLVRGPAQQLRQHRVRDRAGALAPHLRRLLRARRARLVAVRAGLGVGQHEGAQAGGMAAHERERGAAAHRHAAE